MSRAEPTPEPTRNFVSRSFETWSRVASSIPRTAALSMVGPGLLIVLGYVFWVKFGADKLDQSYYGLQPDNIVLTDLPDWIKSDVVEEVFTGSRLDGISLQDREACSTIAAAFSSHPWIERVVRATKMAGSQVKVDVEFRRPFAWIYFEEPTSTKAVNNSSSTSSSDVYYFIVDPYGVKLPSKDFSADDLPRYFHIYCPGIERPNGLVGTTYTDPRVKNALEICALVEDMRAEFGIESVQVKPEESSSFSSGRWTYVVQLKDNREIVWGHAPGEELQGEDKPQIKVAKIRQQLSGLPVSAEPIH